MPVLKSFTSIWGLSSVVVFEPLPQAAQDKRIHSTREKPRKNLLSFIKASPFKVLCFENRLAYFNIKRWFFQGYKKALRGVYWGGLQARFEYECAIIRYKDNRKDDNGTKLRY